MLKTRKRNLVVMIAFLLSLFSSYTAFSQSTVYVFIPESWDPIPIKINNQDVFEMQGDPKGSGMTARFSACKKKCILKSEGKVIISVDFSMKNRANPDIVYNIASEIQLNLSENSIHYVKMSPKGLNDIQFKEIAEKDAQKLLKNKKYVLLPEYVENE